MKKVFYIIVFIFIFYSYTSAQTNSIKTVVHVLYTSGLDIPDATVLNYINEVNKGFSKQLTPTFTRSTSIFDTLWKNTEIQLCMATIDPNGLPTNGITHTLVSGPESPGSIPSVSPWNGTQYFNIYLAPVNYEPGFPSFVLGGWASTPTNPVPFSTYSFVVVATNSIPFIPQLLSHEIGHVFGLEHLSDDVIADTPKGMEYPNASTGYSTNCSSTLQSANTTTVVEDGMHWGGVDPPDMVENFMSLTFCCSYMFTNGQKNVMQSYIQTYLSSWITSACSTTSTNNYSSENSKIELFPNPAIDNLKIRNIKIQEEQKFILTNTLGEVVLVGELKKDNNEINIASLVSGIYLIHFENNTNTPIKFIKQ